MPSNKKFFNSCVGIGIIGNAVGRMGNSTVDERLSSADGEGRGIVQSFGELTGPAEIDDVFENNRGGKIVLTDEIIDRNSKI